MKERGILFSGPMVRAILEGRKTQTRRPVNLKSAKRVLSGPGSDHWKVFKDSYKEMWWWGNQWGAIEVKCPYGQTGDRLWVRETWAHYQTVNHINRSGGRAFSEVSDGLAAYKADGFDSVAQLKDHIRSMTDSSTEAIEVNGDRWRPSIHMPRWASRITLEITGIAVQRVRQISINDVLAEGLYLSTDKNDDGDFQNAWEAIYPGSWDRNDWVWVVEFKQVTTKEN